MLAGEPNTNRIGTASRADSLDLIRRHRHADTGPANQNSFFALPLRNEITNLLGNNRVIDAQRIIGSDIDNRMP